MAMAQTMAGAEHGVATEAVMADINTVATHQGIRPPPHIITGAQCNLPKLFFYPLNQGLNKKSIRFSYKPDPIYYQNYSKCTS